MRSACPRAESRARSASGRVSCWRRTTASTRRSPWRCSRRWAARCARWSTVSRCSPASRRRTSTSSSWTARCRRWTASPRPARSASARRSLRRAARGDGDFRSSLSPLTPCNTTVRTVWMREWTTTWPSPSPRTSSGTWSGSGWTAAVRHVPWRGRCWRQSPRKRRRSRLAAPTFDARKLESLLPSDPAGDGSLARRIVDVYLKSSTELASALSDAVASQGSREDRANRPYAQVEQRAGGSGEALGPLQGPRGMREGRIPGRSPGALRRPLGGDRGRSRADGGPSIRSWR